PQGEMSPSIFPLSFIFVFFNPDGSFGGLTSSRFNGFIGDPSKNDVTVIGLDQNTTWSTVPPPDTYSDDTRTWFNVDSANLKVAGVQTLKGGSGNDEFDIPIGMTFDNNGPTASFKSIDGGGGLFGSDTLKVVAPGGFLTGDINDSIKSFDITSTAGLP